MNARWGATRTARLLAIVGLWIVSAWAQPARADMWRWTDEKGNVNITQDLSEVPAEFRDGAQPVTRGKDAGPALTPDGAPTPERDPRETSDLADKGASGGSAVTDTRVKDRAYWEGRARALKDQVKEQEDKIVQIKGRETFKAKNYTGGMAGFRKELAQANQKLESLKKQLTVDLPAEAAASGANPAWVK